MLPVLVLLIVLVLIALRNTTPIKPPIWFIMFSGACGVLLFGCISPEEALKAVNFDVILFLFGVFVLGQALEESGYLSHLSYKIFRRAKSLDSVLLYILFGGGFASAFLMNDTCAIIGTPVVLMLAGRHKIHSKPLLLALAFSITIGSVVSPIGNPQNLLIALAGDIGNPFITFTQHLLLPTLINLYLTYVVIKLFYRRNFTKQYINHYEEPIKNPHLAKLCKASLYLMGFMVSAKILVTWINPEIDFRLTYIALASAAPILLLSPERLNLAKRIDWSTLIFFASMFILMQSVWDTGVFQEAIRDAGLEVKSIPAILFISVALSQLISNVPLVALYLPVLKHAGAGVKEFIALAAGSTIAGNLSIMGAASNVIIIQNAEKRGETLTFWEFLKIGIPVTALNVCIYWVFLL